LMLAATIWGDPDEAGYLADPKSTLTGFETFLNFLNNMPFICDDTSKIKRNFSSNKQDFSEFIYFLCGGVGKRRSNVNLGNNQLQTWKNCSLTNAEKPLTTELSNGGELLRCIELKTEEGIIFDDGTKGKDTADFLRLNYGFLGKKFIMEIQKMGLEKFREIYNEFIKMINEKDVTKEKEGKQINPVALILASYKVFIDCVLGEGEYLDFDFMFELIRSTNEMNDTERAYEFIMNEVALNKKKFAVLEHEPEQRWGYFYERDGIEYVLINPNAFNGFCERGNFNKGMVIEWAVSNGLALTDKNRLTKKIKNDAKSIRGNFMMLVMREIVEERNIENGFIDSQTEMTDKEVKEVFNEGEIPF